MGEIKEGLTQQIINDNELNDSKAKMYFVCYAIGIEVKYCEIDLVRDRKEIEGVCSRGGKLFLSWHGKWSTDIFVLDYKLALANFKSLKRN